MIVRWPANFICGLGTVIFLIFYNMNIKDIDSIVIHCSATREGVNYTLKDIELWHKSRGFRCIGYNYVIDLDGTVEVGRPLTMDGAHCDTAGLSGKSYNKHSIGICYIGGLDANNKAKDTRTLEQKESMVKLVYELIDKYPNIKEVIGHRDASPDKNGDGMISRIEWLKSCPCFDVKSEFPISKCIAKR